MIKNAPSAFEKSSHKTKEFLKTRKGLFHLGHMEETYGHHSKIRGSGRCTAGCRDPYAKRGKGMLIFGGDLSKTRWTSGAIRKSLNDSHTYLAKKMVFLRYEFIICFLFNKDGLKINFAAIFLRNFKVCLF